jgi:pantothenate kinase
MSINISTKPEVGVVNVGEEITTEQLAAITSSSNPTGTNPLLTASAGNAAYAGLTANNTLTGTQVYNINSAGTGFRITHTGAGECFRVEDENPDSTPFVIDAIGNVGIGTNTPSTKFNVVTSGSTDAVRITNTGTGNSFVVEDDTNPDTSPFVIDAAGRVGIGVSTTASKMEVLGRSYFRDTSGSGGNPVLWVRQEGASAATALQVTNQGTGNSFVVEDESGDTSPFIIDAAGAVGIGRQPTAGFRLDLAGNILVAGSVHTFSLASQGAVITQVSGTANTLTVNNSGTGNSFVVNDDGTGDLSPFIIDNVGNVTLGGTLRFGTEGAISSLTYQTTGLAATVDRTAFPNEIAIVIAGVTYRIPARQV